MRHHLFRLRYLAPAPAHIFLGWTSPETRTLKLESAIWTGTHLRRLIDLPLLPASSGIVGGAPVPTVIYLK